MEIQHEFLTHINYFDLPKIEKILMHHGISFFIKDTFSSSVIAGWADPGVSFNEKMLFVQVEYLNQSRDLLRDYIK